MPDTKRPDPVPFASQLPKSTKRRLKSTAIKNRLKIWQALDDAVNEYCDKMKT